MSETFRVSGKKVELPKAGSDWSFTVRPGGWVIAERKTASGVERKRFALHEAKGKLSASLGGFLYFGGLQAQARGGASAGSDADLTAQFPGKVRKILVAEGASVGEGDPLVLVEAMKMEFTVKAPYSGTVKKVLVKEAQQLAPGDRFVELEAVKK